MSLFSKKEEVRLNVTGMHCEKCVARVKAALEAVDGVTQAEVDLEYKLGRSNRRIDVLLSDPQQKKYVIIELKQDGRADSQMKRILLNHRVKPTRMSKYCIGTTITNPNVKSNRFKKKIRRIEKVINSKIECYD